MSVKNSSDGVKCDRAYHAKFNGMTIIKCNKEYNVVCSHTRYCSECGFYILNSTATTCPANNWGTNVIKEKSSGCGCRK